MNGTSKIEDFTKLLLGLDYAEFLTGKEEEIEEFILSFIRERVAQRIATITKRHDIIDAVVNSHTSSIPEQLKADKSFFQLFLNLKNLKELQRP